MKKAVEYFLYPVPTVDDLAAPVAEIARHELARQLAARQQPFAPHSILVVPPQDYPRFRQTRFFSVAYGERVTPQRTLLFGPDRLTVIERDTGLRRIDIPYAALVSVEMAVVLLYAYVAFRWMNGDRLETLKIEYNAVGEAFIRDAVQHLRSTWPQAATATGDQTQAILKPLPMKFRNYLRLSLLPGEQVGGVVFQPAIGSPRRWLRPRLSGDRTVALTTAGITLVEEEASWSLGYGVATRYFPAESIIRIDLEPSGNLVWARIRLTGHNAHVPLSGENANRLYELLPRCLPSVPAAMAEAAPAGT
jgi:hypothetical protein